MNKQDIYFSQLRDGLVSWRRMGHGLWPIRYWPNSVIENYVQTLQEVCEGQSSGRSFVFFVQNGRDLILLIRLVIKDYYRCSASEKNSLANEDPVLLLETILFALIGMVYPEEPGSTTIEEILRIN